MKIEDLQELLNHSCYRWSQHGLERIQERGISISDVLTCIQIGEIIEDYPDDFPHPSCLIYGKLQDGRVLHVVVGSNGEKIDIITAYYPNKVKFHDDLKTRRKK